MKISTKNEKNEKNNEKMKKMRSGQPVCCATDGQTGEQTDRKSDI